MGFFFENEEKKENAQECCILPKSKEDIEQLGKEKFVLLRESIKNELISKFLEFLSGNTQIEVEIERILACARMEGYTLRYIFECENVEASDVPCYLAVLFIKDTEVWVNKEQSPTEVSENMKVMQHFMNLLNELRNAIGRSHFSKVILRNHNNDPNDYEFVDYEEDEKKIREQMPELSSDDKALIKQFLECTSKMMERKLNVLLWENCARIQKILCIYRVCTENEELVQGYLDSLQDLYCGPFVTMKTRHQELLQTTARDVLDAYMLE